MKYYDILKLLEAKQVGILYHYTSIENAIKICKDNMLRPMNYETVSFTRDKNFHGVQRDSIACGVKFVVDGDKLSENYKIQPFNYFNTSDKSHGSENKYYHYDYYDEQEEVVKSPIRNLSKYVIKVYIDLHHADCFFEGFELEDERILEDFPDEDVLMEYFNRFFPTEWSK
jgi:hypothetical protein